MTSSSEIKLRYFLKRHTVTRDDTAASEARKLACPNCGLVQVAVRGERNQLTFCGRCKTQLEHCAGKSLDATLAAAVAILALLGPALFAPFITTSAFGATRTSTLPMSSFAIWNGGWPVLAIIVFLFIVVFPILRFGALAAVLMAIRLRRRPPWLALGFRIADSLQTWAMLDVFLLGMLVAYARLRASLYVELDAGAICLIAAALLSLIARATLDKALVWRTIAPDCPVRAGESAVACLSCELLVDLRCESGKCPRCGASVQVRKPQSLVRASALLIAAALLYFPANLLPIATIPIGLTPTPYTVLGGVTDLLESHLLGLALLVFSASFTIPLLKMVGLAWCALSVRSRATRNLVARTRVYRVIEEIGRWSMVDPLTIACFVPVLKFNTLIDGRAEAAATPFALVVVLTTVAVKCFDSRLMWDAAGRNA